jgi:hypothetical protein
MLSKTRSAATLIMPTTGGRKVIAHDLVNIKPARSGDSPPMVVTIPKKIVNAMKLKKGESLGVYTGGEKIFLDRFEEHTI